MRILDSLADACLRLAARRWPADLRDEQAREWAAELHALRRDPDAGAATRALRQLRYAVSLAWSPPVEDEHGVPRGWRETLPGIGHELRPVLGLFGAALFCAMLATGLPMLARGTAETLFGSYSAIPGDGEAQLVGMIGLLLAVPLAGWMGSWLGRRLPVAWAHRTRLGAAGSAVVAPMVIALGAGAMHAMEAVRYDVDPDAAALGVSVYLAPDPFPGLLVWAVLATPLAGYVVRLTRAGRRFRAILASLAGGLLILELVTVADGLRSAVKVGLDLTTAPLWFPFTLIGIRSNIGGWLGSGEQAHDAADAIEISASSAVQMLLVCTVFVLCYGVRAARTRPDHLVVPAAVPGPVRHGSPARRYFAFGVVAVALVVWAYGLAFVTPALLGPRFADTGLGGELHIWAHEQRQAAILLAMLGLMLAMAGRGPVLGPVPLGTIALLVVDLVADAADLGGAAVFAGALGIGAAVTGVVWWLNGVLASVRSDAIATRRIFAGTAVVAAFCAPVLAIHSTWPGEEHLVPAGLPAGTAVLAALLTAVAGVSALAARQTPLPLRLAVPSVGGAVLVMGAFGAMTVGTAPAAQYTGMLGPVLLVLALALLRRPRPVRRGRVIAIWTALGVGSVLLTVPAFYVQLMAAVLVGQVLMEAAGYGFPADGLPLLPGTALWAVPLAVLIATWVVRRPKPEPVPWRVVAPEPPPALPGTATGN